MSNEYYAIILEFNSRAVKLGFAHESKEHVLITPDNPLWSKYIKASRNKLAPAFLELSLHCVDPETRDSLYSAACKDSDLKRVLDAYQLDCEQLQWYHWDSDRFEGLSRLIRHLLSFYLLITPLKSKLFVVDSGLSALGKRQLWEMISKHQASASITFLSYSICSAIASGIRDALVVDVGWDFCRVSSIVDLRVLHSDDHIDISHESLHYKILQRSHSGTFADVEKLLHMSLTYSNSDLEPESVLKTGLNIDMIQVLPKVLADAIKKSNVDIRLLLASNIIFTGFIAKSPLLQEKIIEETSTLLETMDAQAVENLGAWSGASLYCSTILLKEDYDSWKHILIGHNLLKIDIARELERHNA